MAWEDRNETVYYYRKRREGKHVISEYVGKGLIGQLAEEMDSEERYKKDLDQSEFRKQQWTIKIIDEQVSDVEKYTRAMTRAVMLVSGYHSHKRQWRKRRDVRRNDQNSD